MSKKRKTVLNSDDQIGADGFWVKTWSETIGDEFIQYQTRAVGLWGNLNTRCDPTGKYVEKNKSYGGCLNEFSGFQEFAGWCQSQYGYCLLDQYGKRWHLEKDLLSQSTCKKYSPDTCVFITPRMNTMISQILSVTTGNLSRGVFKIGDKFGSQITDRKKTKYLGCFDTEIMASESHLKARIEIIREELSFMNHQDNRVNDAIEIIINSVTQRED